MLLSEVLFILLLEEEEVAFEFFIYDAGQVDGEIEIRERKRN
jgi:hypothetical protein